MQRGELVYNITSSLALTLCTNIGRKPLLEPGFKNTSLAKEEVANYCPVSNLLLLGWVIEHMVVEQPQGLLDDLSALDSFVSRFRPRFGTTAASAALVDDLA